MAKVSYANLKLKTNKEVKTFKVGDQEIEVLQYLPVEDKYDLIMVTLQKAEENGIYNSLMLDVYFHLHLIYMYSNLSFTDKQKENEFKLYDAIKSNGLLNAFLEAFDEAEYDELLGHIEEMMDMILTYKNTAGAVLQSVIQDLPRNAEVAANIVKSFDAKQYQAVIDFATAANGGRNIETNR